jgi:hypothetical protein
MVRVLTRTINLPLKQEFEAEGVRSSEAAANSQAPELPALYRANNRLSSPHGKPGFQSAAKLIKGKLGHTGQQRRDGVPDDTLERGPAGRPGALA